MPPQSARGEQSPLNRRDLLQITELHRQQRPTLG